jgi:hypothetical protein
MSVQSRVNLPHRDRDRDRDRGCDGNRPVTPVCVVLQ